MNRSRQSKYIIGFISIIALVAACTTAQIQPANTPEPTATEQSAPDTINIDNTPESNGYGVMVAPNICLPFDPAIDSASGERELYRLPLVREIHAGMTRVSSDDPPRVELELAELYTVSDDDTTYTFTLRKGLKFSDGSRLDASDVKWSWERALRISTPWGAANNALGKIQGAGAVIKDGERIREAEEELKSENPLSRETVEPEVLLSGVRVVDALNLEVSLIDPEPRFLEMLSHPVTFVLNQSNVDAWNVSWNNEVFPGVAFADITGATGLPLPYDAMPVGAGPFKLIAYDPSADYETCAIARNEHYWDQTPDIEGVIFVPPNTPFGRTVESAYVADLIDYVLPPRENVGEGLTQESAIVTSQRPPFTRFMALNPNHPPFDDVETRRLLLAANDLAEVYSPNEVGWPNTIVPHRLVPGYTYCDRSPYVSTSDESVRESHLDGYTVEFWRLGHDYILDRVETLLNQWRRATGLGYELHNLEADEIETLMSEGALHLRLVEVSPSVPSIAPVFASLIGLFGGAEAHQEWSDVEAMITQAMQESDDAKRFELFRDVECQLYNRALVLPMLVDWIDFEINTQPWVEGFELPTFGRSAFRDVRLGENVPDRQLPW